MYAMMCKKCHRLIVVIINKYSIKHYAHEWLQGQLTAYNTHSQHHRIGHGNTFENLSKRVYYVKLR